MVKKKKKKIKKLKIVQIIIINLVFFVFFLSIAAVGLEFYLRQKHQNTSESVSAVGIKIFQPSLINGFEHKPGAKDLNGFGSPTPVIQIDDLGLRNDTEKADLNGNNILLLGDSFTFATGLNYKDSFAVQLERKLGKDWQVHNGGTIGYTIDNYYMLMKKLVPVIKPKIVVVNIFVGNDVTELRRHEWDIRDNELMAVKDTEIFVDDEGRLNSWTSKEPASYLFDWLSKKLDAYLYQTGRKIDFSDKNITLTWPVFLPEQHQGYDPRLPEFWKRFMEVMEKFEIYTNNNNIKLVFVLIPIDVQVSKTYWKKYSHVPSLFDDEAWVAKRPQSRIMDYCFANNNICLDLLPAFQENKHNGKLYFTNDDPHLDIHGHKVVADEIYKLLKQLINE